MKLSELGEDALVARLTRGLPRGASLLVGPGDDCAVVGRRSDAVWTLLKTDCVIEGVHFTGDTEFARVGWKALARNVSDIAAMGGEPEHALVTVAMPPGLEVAKVDGLYKGLRRCARKFGISIAGGETARSPAWSLSPWRSRGGWNGRGVSCVREANPVTCFSSRGAWADRAQASISISLPASPRRAGSRNISGCMP